MTRAEPRTPKRQTIAVWTQTASGRKLWQEGESGIENQNYRTDLAYGAIAADGCFGLAFALYLMGVPAAGLSVFDYIGVGTIFSVFLSACWVIYDEYWLTARIEEGLVKRLRIKELKQGAHIEFDGKSYQVETINHSNGEILIQRVGQRGSIIVQIEGQR